MVEVQWLGHAAFKIRFDGMIVFVDPWLDGNPKASIKTSEVRKADLVCVTHDHVDHLGNAFEICKQTSAVFAATPELCEYAKDNAVMNIVAFNIGGTATVGGMTITMTQASHTATRGVATGFVLRGKEWSIYHAGDTGLFGDMKTIGKLYKPDIALLPIGGFYTMAAEEAVEAVLWIKPRVVVPMHYQTFPVLAKSAGEFIKGVQKRSKNVKVVELAPGETFTLEKLR